MSRLDIARLYDEHVDFVWRMLVKLGVPTMSIEDAVQDVFVILHRRRDDFRHASSVSTWIGGVVLRVAADYRRGEARHERRQQRDEATAQTSRGPHEQVVSAQVLKLGMQLLEQLDEEQRTVFALIELEGFTAAEVAEITGAGINTVSSRLRLARKHFNELVVAFRATEEQR